MFVTGEIPAGFNSTAAEEVKKSVSIPVISVGRYNDPSIAEDVLLSGKADLISFGRESLAEPELPNKLAEGRLDEIIPCIACLQGCAGYMFDPNKLKITCLMNPFTGKEGTHKIEPSQKVKKVMVVGAGPGGLEAAWILAKRGHRVTCYEKEQQIGGQFRIGGIPPTKQDIMKGVKYQLTMCNKFGVEIITGTEVTPEYIFAEKPDAVVLATGGNPLYPNIIGIKNPNLLNAIDVLDAKKQYGQKVLVIGGGMVGAETADFLCERGCDVTVVEMRSGIALDVLEGPAKLLKSRLERCKATIITDATVTEIFEDGIMYQSEGKDMRISGFDNVVLALGTTANNPLEKALQGKVNELYTIGDAVKARKAIDAMEEAIEVAIRI
jgi:NADPH-dependent 2,4-dienoyl-CoA reductase/sulfur reductase-like enzyme